jgi:hypothetical protein
MTTSSLAGRMLISISNNYTGFGRSCGCWERRLGHSIKEALEIKRRNFGTQWLSSEACSITNEPTCQWIPLRRAVAHVSY